MKSPSSNLPAWVKPVSSRRGPLCCQKRIPRRRRTVSRFSRDSWNFSNSARSRCSGLSRFGKLRKRPRAPLLNYRRMERVNRTFVVFIGCIQNDEINRNEKNCNCYYLHDKEFSLQKSTSNIAENQGWEIFEVTRTKMKRIYVSKKKK